MKTRKNLKLLYQQREIIMHNIIAATKDYIAECGDRHLLYVTEHAIVRYLERIKGYEFEEHLTDVEKLATIKIPPEKIREEMLSHEDELYIVSNFKATYDKGPLKFIIKNLSVITVLNKDK